MTKKKSPKKPAATRSMASLSNANLTKLVAVHAFYLILSDLVVDSGIDPQLMADAKGITSSAIADLSNEYARRHGQDQLNELLHEITVKMGAPAA